MRPRRVFYVVYFRNRRLQYSLDAMRFIANPLEKNYAHITVRGPYKQRYNLRAMDKAIDGTEVTAHGVGSFFGYSQNTVFIKCHSEMLRDVWRKTDYGFNPHVTIYDGESREFAEILLGRLYHLTIKFRFVVGRLHPLVTRSGQYSMELSQAFDEALFKEITGIHVSASEVGGLSNEKRVTLIESFARRLPELASSAEHRGEVMSLTQP